MSKNLQKGFEICGLSPVNRQHVLKQLPVHNENTESNSFLNETVNNQTAKVYPEDKNKEIKLL